MLVIADIWMYQIAWDFLKKMVVWDCTLFSFLFFLTWAALAQTSWMFFFSFSFLFFLSLNIFLDLERSFVFMTSTCLPDLISLLLIKIYYCNKDTSPVQYWRITIIFWRMVIMFVNILSKFGDLVEAQHPQWHWQPYFRTLNQ